MDQERENCRELGNAVEPQPDKTPGWPHAPTHWTFESGIYMVTAATFQKQHLFDGDQRLDLLHDMLLEHATKFGWTMRAWAVFPNHYHFIARSPDDPSNLKNFLGSLHMLSAREINRLDQLTGRKVWHNFRESRITFQRSYLARLRYVTENPVRHGVASRASLYRWCSARWFCASAPKSFIQTVARFPIDRLEIDDDY